MTGRLIATALLLVLPALATAQECGRPDFSRSEPAALYIWQDCDSRNWQLRALGGGDYAGFRGSLFTDGEFLAATGVQLGAADSLDFDAGTVDFSFRVWGNNLDGLVLETRDDARVYLDLEQGHEHPVYLGRQAEPVDRFPARLGGRGKKYNLVFVLTDDQRFDTLWAMPVLGRLIAANGVTFTEAIVTSPLCCPARASLLAGGLLDKNTGVYSNTAPSGSFDFFPDQENLGTLLQAAGYRTGLIGKVMNEYPAGYVMPGWDYLVANVGPGREDWYRPSPTVGSSTILPAQGEVVAAVDQYITDYQRDRALEFIGDSSEQPFFLLVSTYAPHAPATAPPEDFARFSDFVYPGRAVNESDLLDKPRWVWDPDRARLAKEPLTGFPAQQLASLQAVDRMLGDIVRALDERDVLDDTIIVFSSDNGFMWGEHGIWRKTHEFEESLRVPLVIRFPGLAPRGDARLVAVDIDVPALVLDIAGSDFSTDGASLMPLLLRKSGNWRDWVPVSLYAHDSPRSWAGIRGARWKYTENILGDRMLYDLVRDPFELENLAGRPEHSAIEFEMKTLSDSEKGLMITTLGVPQAQVGLPYSRQLSAWGGSAPYRWSVVERPVRVALGNDATNLPAESFPLQLDQLASGCGEPGFDPDVDRGAFLWRDCASGHWKLAVTSGGDYEKLVGAIRSTGGLALVDSEGIADNDSIEQSGNRISFSIQVWGGRRNLLEFSAPAGSGLYLDIDTHRLPNGLSLKPDTGRIFGTPRSIQERVVWIRVTDRSVRKIDGAPQAFTVPYRFVVR